MNITTLTENPTLLAAARLDKLRGIMSRAAFDAFALVPGPYIFYLTGAQFQIASRPLVLFVAPEGDPALVIPALEQPRIVGRSTLPLQYFPYTDAEGYERAFEAACLALGMAGKRIGVEGLKMRVLEGKLVEQAAPKSRVDHAEDALMWLRIHKDAQEVDTMRRAIELSEAALAAALPKVRAGMTERALLSALRAEAEAIGGNLDAFDAIVLGGPNSGQPHGDVTERPVAEGELLLYDFGTRVAGYNSDITRTFVIGQPSAEVRKVYDTVRAANQAAIEAVAPGVTAQAVDRAARQVIADAGYGEYFIHRTGHGLGIDIHEAPYIRDGNSMMLEPGMVFTIEPGIYIPGLGGVRIEDNVVVTNTGAEVLTSFPKALRVLGQ